MKQILLLLSLSGMLLADQTFVITFGTTKENNQEKISTNTLTYNKISAKSDYDPNKVIYYTDGSESKITARFVNEENVNNISTTNGAITLTDKTEPLSNIFGDATINGVLTSTDSNTLQIIFKGMDSGNYTLYASGARGNIPSPAAATYYFLTGADNIQASVVAEEKSKYTILTTSQYSKSSTITAHTYNDSPNIIRWALMRFDFSVKEGIEQIIFNSASNGNIAAIALVEHSAPEPTTSTLSLLALAALITRRRRK